MFTGLMLYSVASLAEEEGNLALAPARLRVFKAPGVEMRLYRNSLCYKKGWMGLSGGDNVARNSWQTFKSWFGWDGNSRIGMPQTNATRQLISQGKASGQESFHEFAIAAEQPLTLVVQVNSKGHYYCDPVLSAYFIPETGKDYEARLDMTSDSCVIHVGELQQKDDGQQLERLTLQPGKSCDWDSFVPTESHQ